MAIFFITKVSSIILVAHASILLYSHTSPICGLSSSCRGRTMHEADSLPYPLLLFIYNFFLVLVVIALTGPDWPWRCYLFKCPPHILSHVRLLLQIQVNSGAFLNISNWIVSHLPGGHLPPPIFRHLPPPNSDIYHPQKQYICQEDNCHLQFFFLFLAHFSWLFRLTAHEGHQGWEGGGA